MVFNSVIFIFCFLPIFLLIYYFVPARARNPVLFAGSLFFYAWGDPTYLVLMLFSSFFNYYMGKELGKITDEDPSRKRNLIFAVVINLLILGFFKYWGFFLDTISGITGLKLTYPQLALPIGLSFYTFKNLSYILDIYMGKTEPCKGFFPYAVYSTMFPHMTAGPIVRYTDISESISRRSINTTRLGAGAELFIKGLSKKVLLADNLSALYTTLQASGTTSFVGTWLAIGAYTLELYFDFSGYSDMAIGLGQMLGFNFNKNFDYPYISTSVSEFWRRWHISLGSWFVITSTSHWEATVFPQADTSATSLWYGHSPVSGMAPAGTLCSGVFTTVSFFWQRNSFLDVFLRKHPSGFAIYIPCLP